MRGRFITVEGGEGVGKSRFSESLAKAIRARGISLLATREPGGLPLADALRALFLAPLVGDIPGAEAALLIVSAARAQHIQRRIQPALQGGQWVLCDRFYDSTRVYQGYLGGLVEQAVEEVITFSVGACHPDLTFVLDCPPTLAIQRIAGRQATNSQTQSVNRYDAGTLELHAALREGFQKLCQRFPERLYRLDAEQATEKIVAEAIEVLESRGYLP